MVYSERSDKRIVAYPRTRAIANTFLGRAGLRHRDHDRGFESRHRPYSLRLNGRWLSKCCFSIFADQQACAINCTDSVHPIWASQVLQEPVPVAASALRRVSPAAWWPPSVPARRSR
jgi:hypothetical protein